MRPVYKLLSFLFAIIFLWVNLALPIKAQGPVQFANCRLGAGGVKENVIGYNVEQLNMGLYLDWNSRSAPPAGLPAGVTYLQMVRVKQDKVCGKRFCDSPYVNPPTYSVSPSLATIANHATSQPGSLWLIGNEIERRDWDNGGTYDGQDEITPQLYATAFHEIREVIKTADPSAKIAIGSVVQPTPLRLKYLDQVWDSYFTQYGYPMGNDIDVWNIHGFMFREVSGSWGAEIPAGLNDTAGFLAEVNPNTSTGFQTLVDAQYDIEQYKLFIESFRAWMAEHGEQNKPLINSEYGVLFGGPFNDEVSDYLTATFDYMLTKTDDNIGYPADENRLVQGWVWFSLNFDDQEWGRYGSLFNSSTKQLRPVGTAWKNYVSNVGHPLASQPQQNLLVSNLRTIPTYYIEPSGAVTFTLRVDISNSGNNLTSTNNNIVVTFWDGDPNDPGSNQIGGPQTLEDIPGCGQFITTVEVDWPNRVAPENTWYVKVEPFPGEPNQSDNIASDTAYIFNPAPQAELSVVKSVNHTSPVEQFDPVIYTIKVTNPGPGTANNLVIKDELPDGLILNSYDSTQGNYFTRGPWIVGDLPGATTAILTITATVENGQAGKTITNTATISSTDSIDTDSSDNSSSAIIVPRASSKASLPVIIK